MKILIVTATQGESDKIAAQHFDDHDIHIAVTGIGMINTAYLLTKSLSATKYNLVLNLGICGSYDRSRRIGEVVHVHEEIFSEIGATDSNGNFLDLQKMGFKNFTARGIDYYNRIENPNVLSDFFDYNFQSIQNVTGLTLNTVNGDSQRIHNAIKLFNPDTENMEGGAVAAVCLQEDIPYFEFRSISNYVEPRNMAKWDLPLACSAIQDFAIRILNQLKQF